MSSNRPSTNKSDSKIAKRDTMVTRHKSAQMKRQLRTKNRSMKHLTDLLKSPTKETPSTTKTVPVKKKQSPPKAKQSLLKSAESVQNLPQKTFKLSKVLRKEVILIPDEEYYPNKLKRKVSVKKVVLKPKDAFKVIGEIAGSVKRKCGVPVKASDKPTPTSQEASPLHTKLSMAEAMSIMEDQLTDEDLMEILTCPSPVWWEDPPDEEYIEDAIFTRSPSEVTSTPVTSEPMEVDTDRTENDIDRFVVIPNLSARSDKFLKKRSKLEDLLGNIKDKSKENKSKLQNGKNNVFNEDVVVICSNYRANDQSNVNNDKLEAGLSESDDEIMFHNSSMNEDELLKDLENMDIPIANRKRLSDVIVIDDDDDIFLDKATNSNITDVIQKNERNENDEIAVSDSVKSVNENANKTNEVEMTKNLLAVSSRNLSKEISAPKSFDNLSSKSSVINGKEANTISNTNMKFLEDPVDDRDENTRDLNDKMAGTSNENLNKSNNNEAKEKKESSDASNLLTVYKIIEETNGDKSNQDLNRIIGVNLEDYYNKMLKEKTNTDEKGFLYTNDNFKEKSDKANADKDMQCIAVKANEDMECIVATKMNDNSKKFTKLDANTALESIVGAKLSDCYKKSKKVSQKKIKKEENTDINKNDVIENAEEIDNFPTMFCDPCKPSFKRVSEDENVKYCLNCSSIFDTRQCTYCVKKFKTKIYICVPCKIKFCCDNFYKTHAKHGCAYNTVSRKVVFTQLSDNESTPDVQVINYSVRVENSS